MDEQPPEIPEPPPQVPRKALWFTLLAPPSAGLAALVFVMILRAYP